MAEKISMRSLAAEAGVSPAAVSRYINGNGYVSEEKKAQIAAAIKKLNYRLPERRRVKSPHHGTLAIILPPGVGNSYFKEIALRFAQSAQLQGFAAVDHTMVAENLLKTLRHCSAAGADGIFVPAFPDMYLSAELLHFVENSRVPIVFLNEFLEPYPTINSITIDNTACMKQATEELIRHGSRRLAYLGPPIGINKSSALRSRGFLEACRQAGIPPEDSLVAEGDFFQHDHFSECGYTAAQRAFAKNPQLDGLAVWTDNIATGVLWYLYERRLHIPEDVRVITMNDELSGLLCPPLTTMDLPVAQIAQEAVELLARMQDPVERMITRQITLQPRLIRRGSV